MGAPVVERVLVVALTSTLAACGGATTNDDGEVASTTPQTPVELTRLRLEDDHAWYVQYHDGDGFEVPATGRDGALHVVFQDGPFGTTLSTGDERSVVGVAGSVAFRAKTSVATFFSLSVHGLLETDYFAAQDAGSVWPVARVGIDEEWQTSVIRLGSMKPPSSRSERSPRFTLAFIREPSQGPLELWLDDVHFL